MYAQAQVTLSPKYIDWNYCKKKCRENLPDSEQEDPDRSSFEQNMEESKLMDNQDLLHKEREKTNPMMKSTSDMDSGMNFTRKTELNTSTPGDL